MGKQAVKTVVRFLIRILLITMLIMGISVALNGMYLIGVPAIDEVQSVTISYPDVTDAVKTISDREQIELAVKLTGFLKYSLFEKATDTQSPMITMTYLLENGDRISISANRETVWWKGKAHPIKEQGMFINLTEGIFFLKEVQSG